MLRQKGVIYEVVSIYDHPPGREELKRLSSKVSGGAASLVGTRSRKYRELNLAGQNLTEEEWLDWLVREPRLLRRPILTDGQRVIVGFSEKTYDATFS